MEFRDYMLKLESGQKLKLFPYTPTELFHTVNKYYDIELRKYFMTNRNMNLFDYREYFSKGTQHYMLCEYNGKMRIIKFGRQLYEIISSYISLNVYPFSTMNSFLEFSIYLHVNITMRSGFPDYSSSIMSHVDGTEFSLNYYDSNEYKFFDDCMTFVEDNCKLSKHHDIISNLQKRGVISDNDPLMRLLKIKKLKN